MQFQNVLVYASKKIEWQWSGQYERLTLKNSSPAPTIHCIEHSILIFLFQFQEFP